MGTKLLTTQDVAQRLGITRKGVQYLTAAGKLQPTQIVGPNRMNLFDDAEVEQLRAEREEAKAS